MNTKFLIIIGIVIGAGILFVSHVDSNAYGIWFPLSPEELVEESDTIFVGTIIETVPVEVTYESQRAKDGTIKDSVGPETMELDQYTVTVEEFLKNPQSSDTMIILSATVGGVPSGPARISGFDVGDRVLFYLPNEGKQVHFAGQYLPESFEIPTQCDAKTVLKQPKIGGANDFRVMQDGVIVENNFTANKKIQYIFDKDLRTLNGSGFTVDVSIRKILENNEQQTVLEESIYAESQPCEWIATAKWDFVPTAGEYSMWMSYTQDGEGGNTVSGIRFSVIEDIDKTNEINSNFQNIVESQNFEKFPLPNNVREFTQTCHSMWDEYRTNSELRKQFMDEVTIRLLSITPEFESLNGNVESITAQHENNSDSVCFPDSVTTGVFRSKNNASIHKFTLELYGIFFGYQIDDIYPSQYQTSSDKQQKNTLWVSPLKQVNRGILPNDVICGKGLELVLKPTDIPVCVKHTTAQILLDRGWTQPPVSQLSKPVDFSLVAQANNQFAFDFYSMTADYDQNVFFSPHSISTAFAILYEGTRETSADEMQETFGYIPNDKQRRSAALEMHSFLNSPNNSYELNIANALWPSASFEPLSEYVNTAKTFYDSMVQNVDFSGDARNTINKWVESKTNGKIDELFPEGSLTPNTVLAITNTIYFKGSWLHPFDEKDTYEDDFWTSPSESIKVQMMMLDDRKFNIGFSEDLRVIELPYEGNRLSMVILLPNKIDGIKQLEESLSQEKLNDWTDELFYRGTTVYLPKFLLETDYDLKPILKDLGMSSVFDPARADLSGISGSKGLYVSAALHKAFIDVNEKGTEAAAATGIAVEESSSPEFKMNHPFIFFIKDNETGMILFMGKIIDPTS